MKLNPRTQQTRMNPQEQALLRGCQQDTQFKLKEQLLTSTPSKTG